MTQYLLLKNWRGVDANDLQFIQSSQHTGDCFIARRLMHYLLADHRVVIRGHCVPGLGMRIEPHTKPARSKHALNFAGAWLKVLRWIFRVDAALNRSSSQLYVRLLEWQRLAGGNRIWV